MVRIYEDGTYLAKNPYWHEEDSPWKAVKIREIMERNSIDSSRICEVGCGSGEVLNQLSLHYVNKEFIGYEISPQAFDICSRKSKKNLSFKLANILDDDSGFFDVLLIIDVFEHVEDYFGFLRKIKEKSKYKVFHIPLDISVQSVLRVSPIIRARKSVGHIHYFTKETALETLRDTGFNIIDYSYTSGSLELPKRGWKSNILKVPRKLAFSVHRDFAVRVLGGCSLLVLST